MNFDDYVGLPFLEGGRDRAGIDCWGILRLVYAERFGVDLPSFTGAYTLADKQATTDLMAGHMGPWREVKDGSEKIGDGLLMAARRSPSHIGIVVGNGRVLHIESRAGSVIEEYRASRLRRRLLGFYRHINL